MNKKLLTLVGVGVGVLTMASWSFAGDYHSGINLICTDCHVMHFSQ